MTVVEYGSLSLLLVVAGCGDVDSNDKPVDAQTIDDAAIDTAPAELGTEANPARTCAEIQVAGKPSAAYWVKHPDGTSAPFQVYCEQDINGGGWVMLENSVRRDDGTTTTFWQFGYADRLGARGQLAADQNYYNGALYLSGTDYMDVFVDLQDTTRVGAVATASGFNPTTMAFTDPKFVAGNTSVFAAHFAGGWSSYDRGPRCVGRRPELCTAVQQCRAELYQLLLLQLGSDAEEPRLDNGGGPHVSNAVLSSLGLAQQPVEGAYSQVERIARFTRW